MTVYELSVADNMVVTLDYVLRSGGGEELGRSDSARPLQFLQGHGHILPGLEAALYGMTVGEKRQIVVEPADGFGEYQDDDFIVLPRDAFPPEINLDVGQDLQLRDSDTGEEFKGFVAEVHSDSVKLDLNHPLAGETLHFQVTVADLRAATPEEVEHGHVHGPGEAR